jgi:hypothetical protein
MMMMVMMISSSNSQNSVSAFSALLPEVSSSPKLWQKNDQCASQRLSTL